MFACNGFERRESCFDPFLSRRIGIERIGVTAQARQRFARGNRRFLELRRHGLECRIETGQLPQDALRARERRRDATVVAGEQGFDLPRCPSASRPRLEIRLRSSTTAATSPGLGIERLQFGDEMTQQVEPRLTLARTLLEGRALLVERLPGSVGSAYSRVPYGEPAAAIQRLTLVTASRQRLKLELPVHVDQQFAECP